jgi:hypothetical protein
LAANILFSPCKKHHKTNMKKKFVQFILLITFMMLLNLIGHLIGISFIEKYVEYKVEFHFFEMLFFTCIYAIFQIFVFPIHKKYRIFIIPVFTLILFSFILYDDPTGFGDEIIHNITSWVSKIIHIIYFITAYNITNIETRIVCVSLLFSIGYSAYLLAVFSSFKCIMKCLGRKYPFFSLQKTP